MDFTDLLERSPVFQRGWGKLQIDPNSRRNLICVDNLGLLFVYSLDSMKGVYLQVVNLRSLIKYDSFNYLKVELDLTIKQSVVPHFFQFNSTYNLLCIATSRDCYVVELPFQIRSKFEQETFKSDEEEGSMSFETNICKVFSVGSFTTSFNIVQVAWHPLSESHLCILFADATKSFINIYNLGEDTTTQEQSITIPPRFQSKKIASFCFGTETLGWDRFTLFILSDSGELFAKCPVLPFKALIHSRVFKYLIDQTQQMVSEDVIPHERELQLQWLQQVQARIIRKADQEFVQTQGTDHVADMYGPLLDEPLSNASSLFYLQSSPSVLIASKGGHLNVILGFEEIRPKWISNVKRFGFSETNFSLFEEVDCEPCSWSSIVQDPFSKSRVFMQANDSIQSIHFRWLSEINEYLLKGEEPSQVNLPPTDITIVTSTHEREGSGFISGFALITQPAVGKCSLTVTSSGHVFVQDLKIITSIDDLDFELPKHHVVSQLALSDKFITGDFREGTPSLKGFQDLSALVEKWGKDAIRLQSNAKELAERILGVKEMCSRQKEKLFETQQAFTSLIEQQNELQSRLQKIQEDAQQQDFLQRLQRVIQRLADIQSISPVERKYIEELNSFNVNQMKERVNELERTFAQLQEKAKQRHAPNVYLTEKYQNNVTKLLEQETKQIAQTNKAMKDLEKRLGELPL